ncbi:ricin-type beta-trefoil lectin domain protein [Crossiella sp. CA-258035]|uniref:ricin-type beta-trefoil lectin domain protein n=1 Tax=Crossiella sp. CA-258035 TaxID=2981138 RepID=UPI0024BC6E79|nr:ricin-type beta-trefoil lectin domain protein [Crossiella sp. CA-258035]WHT22770.1 ricin-type beta-trefoil lectin domain protein [Crossiella sp. CA-258035]
MRGKSFVPSRGARALGVLVSALLAAAVLAGVPAGAAPAADLRVMPLGDSITEGVAVPGAYRTGLWRRLTGAGHRVDFVGSLANGPSSLGDRDHEGHPGWRIDQIEANVTGWLRRHTPRTVLLHIGTNDVLQNRDLPNAPARLSTLLDRITAAAPAAEVLVATIIPLANPGQEANVRAYNARIPGIVRSKVNAGKRVRLVDMHAALRPADLYDGIHPSAAGHDKMAAAWFSALRTAPETVGAPEADNPAATPPLGWNSWNSFGCNVNETTVRQAADAMVSSGMRTAGYQYVVVDDCWFDPQRDAQGNLRANPTKFPSGMKALGDYIHSRGLKFGIYQVPTERTCAQRVGNYPGQTGSKGHEAQDARTFASWGVDYLKYDWCSPEGSRDEQVARFRLMRDALRATGRPIVYSINPNSFHTITGDEYDWGQVADLWRTTEDLLDIWQNGNVNSYPMGVGNVVDINAPLAAQNRPGHFNDPDMLVVGRPGLSLTESRAHFALWALMAAPLMAGNDIRTMSADVSAILRNSRLLAVNQDRLGLGGKRVRDDGATEVFAKPLADGSVAVGLFNRGGGAATISTTAAQIGLAGGSFTLTDLWTGVTAASSGQISANVPAHGVAVYRVSGGTPLASTTSRLRGGSGRCLDVDNGSTASGAAAVIWDCHTAANQLWTTWAGGEVRVFGDKCLDAENRGTANGTRVFTWPCNGQDNQKWTLNANGSVTNVHSGLCLAVNQAATANGSRLVLWTCNDQPSQQWARA